MCTLDQDIIGGAPAARFTQRFKELIEGGYGLVEPDSAPEGSVSPLAV